MRATSRENGAERLNLKPNSQPTINQPSNDMTDLNNTVRRRGTRPVHYLRGRRLIVEIHPGDVLAMREERRRSGRYEISLDQLYLLLADRQIRLDRDKLNGLIRAKIKDGCPPRLARSEAKKEMRKQ